MARKDERVTLQIQYNTNLHFVLNYFNIFLFFFLEDQLKSYHLNCNEELP